MSKITKENATFIKKNYLTEKQRKGRHIKQCEQTGGDIDFKVDDKIYTLSYKATGVYTDFKFNSMSHRGGIMNRGAGPLKQDKYNKINHTENNLIKKIDKK